jgi:hypothetical protein
MQLEDLGNFSDVLFYLERQGIDKDNAREIVTRVFGWGISAAFDRMRPTRPTPLDAPQLEQLSLIEAPPKPKPPKEPRQIACPWPEDFKMGDVQIKFAAERGFSLSDTQRMWERFRDRNIAKGEKYVGQRGWEAAWRTWVNNQVEFRNRDSNQRKPDHIDGRL